MSLYDQYLQHLIQLASCPGTKEYAWKRAKELAATPELLFEGIDEALKREMLRRKQ